MNKMISILKTVAVAFTVIAIAPEANAQNTYTNIFVDDFQGPTLNKVWRTSLPNAGWRYLVAGTAVYQGSPSYSFQSLDNSSVLQLKTYLDDSQRVGFSSSTIFNKNAPVIYEARFNTLVTSSSTSIDESIELWLFDPNNPNHYDKVALGAINYGSTRLFIADSSITNNGIDTGFDFSDNTWYRLVLTGSPTQEIRASLLDDNGTELIGVDLGHTLTAYGSGFKVGFSQSMGFPGSPYPTATAIDRIRVSCSGDPRSIFQCKPR